MVSLVLGLFLPKIAQHQGTSITCAALPSPFSCRPPPTSAPLHYQAVLGHRAVPGRRNETRCEAQPRAPIGYHLTADWRAPCWRGAGPPCCCVAYEPSNSTSYSDCRGWQGVACALQHHIGSSLTGGARHGRMTCPSALSATTTCTGRGRHNGLAPDRLPSVRSTYAHGKSSWPEEVLWRAQRTTTRSHGFCQRQMATFTRSPRA